MEDFQFVTYKSDSFKEQRTAVETESANRPILTPFGKLIVSAFVIGLLVILLSVSGMLKPIFQKQKVNINLYGTKSDHR